MYYDIVRELNILKYENSDLIAAIEEGHFTISGGTISLTHSLVNGQRIIISGSMTNDGDHIAPVSNLANEEFDGKVYIMRKNKAFDALVSEIETWQSANGNAGAFTAESFGGYSYKRATDSNGSAITWQSAFAKRLRPWRKM